MKCENDADSWQAVRARLSACVWGEHSRAANIAENEDNLLEAPLPVAELHVEIAHNGSKIIDLELYYMAGILMDSMHRLVFARTQAITQSPPVNPPFNAQSLVKLASLSGSGDE